MHHPQGTLTSKFLTHSFIVKFGRLEYGPIVLTNSHNMDRIPLEVFNMIIRNLGGGESFEVVAESLALENNGHIDRFAAINCLRLCNKKLASITAPRLFREIFLYFTEKSHRKMEAISNHPTYREFVKGIHIFHQPVLPICLNKKQIEEILRSDKTLTEGNTPSRFVTSQLTACRSLRIEAFKLPVCLQ